MAVGVWRHALDGIAIAGVREVEVRPGNEDRRPLAGGDIPGARGGAAGLGAVARGRVAEGVVAADKRHRGNVLDESGVLPGQGQHAGSTVEKLFQTFFLGTSKTT